MPQKTRLQWMTTSIFIPSTHIWMEYNCWEVFHKYSLSFLFVPVLWNNKLLITLHLNVNLQCSHFFIKTSEEDKDKTLLKYYANTIVFDLAFSKQRYRGNQAENIDVKRLIS